MKVGILANSLKAGGKLYETVNGLAFCDPWLIWCPQKKSITFRDYLMLLRSFLFSTNSLALWRLWISGKIILLKRDLAHPDSINKLKAMEMDVGLHKSGSIYRENTIDCFKLGILNAHIGILPKYRGRCVMEWSLLQGDPTGVSVFFLDPGIDTGGRMIFKREFPVTERGNISQAKNYLFSLDAGLYKEALQYLHDKNFALLENDGSGKRYYVMSKLFSSVVEETLTRIPEKQVF